MGNYHFMTVMFHDGDSGHGKREKGFEVWTNNSQIQSENRDCILPTQTSWQVSNQYTEIYELKLRASPCIQRVDRTFQCNTVTDRHGSHRHSSGHDA